MKGKLNHGLPFAAYPENYLTQTFVDADLAEKEDQNSISGSSYFSFGTVIQWCLRQQSIVYCSRCKVN